MVDQSLGAEEVDDVVVHEDVRLTESDGHVVVEAVSGVVGGFRGRVVACALVVVGYGGGMLEAFLLGGEETKLTNSPEELKGSSPRSTRYVFLPGLQKAHNDLPLKSGPKPCP